MPAGGRQGGNGVTSKEPEILVCSGLWGQDGDSSWTRLSSFGKGTYLGSQVSSRCPPDAAPTGSPAVNPDRGAQPRTRKEVCIWVGSQGVGSCPRRQAGPPDGLAPRPGPPRDHAGGGGTLPFIYKLLEVLGEDATGQLGRWLWERAERWGSNAQGWFRNHREKVLPGPEPVRTA